MLVFSCGGLSSVTGFITALNHSIVSSLYLVLVLASHGSRVTDGTSQVLHVGVSGGFSRGIPAFAPPTDWLVLVWVK